MWGETVDPGGPHEWEDWIKGRELLECVGEELMGGMVVSCEKWW